MLIFHLLFPHLLIMTASELHCGGSMSCSRAVGHMKVGQTCSTSPVLKDVSHWALYWSRNTTLNTMNGVYVM